MKLRSEELSDNYFEYFKEKGNLLSILKIIVKRDSLTVVIN